MNKKYLSALLFGALTVASTGTFTSCKDYDDEIAGLQEQMNQKASKEDLTAKLGELQNGVNEAKATANEALAKAKEALDAIGKGQPSKSGITAEEAQTMIDKATKDLASLKQVDAKIAELKKELEANFVTAEALTALQKKVETLTVEVMNLIGHRLSSLSVIATEHINGIAAIKLTTLKYTPQEYFKPTGHDATKCMGDVLAGKTALSALHPSMPWLDHHAVTGAKDVYVSSENNKAYFHVSPSMGVTNSDIEMPSFNCITSSNKTRAEKIAKVNSPIQPVSYEIDGDQMMVKFKKTVTDFIGTTGEAHGASASATENFYMASLKAPIAKKNWTAAEKAIENNEVAVNSEYVRLEEELKVPYLVNTQTKFTEPFEAGYESFADEVQKNAKGEAFYVHYHDSICAYNSKANEMVDYRQPYNKDLDLKTLVTVCVADPAVAPSLWPSHVKHVDFTNEYKNYGLAFRFYLPETPYITLGGDDHNSNKTDQQKFAKLDSHENGILSSKVYTIDGNSATAVGREPLVRVELQDTVNNHLIALRYIKIKWVKETGEKPLDVKFNDAIYKCGNYVDLIGTEKMNVDIYDKVKQGGMTKQEFHAVYTNFVDDGKAHGTAKVIENNEAGVESFNIEWTLTHKDIVTAYPVWSKQEKMDFHKVVYWIDPTGAYPTLKITMTRSIYKPQFGHFGYDGRYWKNDDKFNIFNVNPIVYDTNENNPAWLNANNSERDNHKNWSTCNIYTDLLNGFLDKNDKMPMLGAGYLLHYTDPQAKDPQAKVDYINLYDNEGVKFLFDAEKLANGTNPEGKKYVYPYFDGSKVVEKPATVSPDGMTLFVNDEKAAEIMHFGTNFCQDPNNPRKGAITYNMRLQEANPAGIPFGGDPAKMATTTNYLQNGSDNADPTPTEAAKSLVGYYVPIKLVADLCNDDAQHTEAHTQVIKTYDAFIIKPMTIATGTTENFTDATASGSVIDVKNAFTYTCWNANDKGEYYTASKSANATELQKAMWDFYECQEGVWRTDMIKTNLKKNAEGNLVPTAGVKDGPLPSNTTVKYDKETETLTYYNHSGTPVNWDYEIYIPVEFGYKWKTMIETFHVTVKQNAGTPSK